MVGEIPTVVTRERVKKFLCELDDSEDGFEIHEHGEHEYVFPTQHGLIFVNFSRPSILQIHGLWRGVCTSEDDFGALTQQVHSCNVHRSGPKAYLVQIKEAERFSIGAEASLVISKGATNAQLTSFYETALTMVLGYFQDLERALPHLVASSTERQDG